MRHFTLAATGIAFVALLSSAPAMARAYNTDNIGWNRGGPYKTDTTAGSVQQCFVAREKVPCTSNAPTAAPICAGSDFSKMRGHFGRGQVSIMTGGPISPGVLIAILISGPGWALTSITMGVLTATSVSTADLFGWFAGSLDG